MQRAQASQLNPLKESRMPSTPRHGGHALLAALLASALAAASAQPVPPGSGSDDGGYVSGGQEHVSTAMVTLLAAVIAVFVFIAVSTVYLRHCSGYAVRSRSPGDDDRAVAHSLDAFFVSRSWRQRRPRSRGLDPDVIEAFPTMTYAEAKALRVGKGGAGAVECAVCLSEFEDEERLRLLLPKCSHAFHPDCIGEWLASHVTCPVCRCNLDPDSKDTSSDGDPTSFPPIPLASSISSETALAWQDGNQLPVAVVIDVVTEEEEEERRQEALELQRLGTQRRAMRSRSWRRPVTTPPQLARWHSTGHSLAARLDRDLERFTLRLPEHVRREMVAATEHSLQLRRRRRAAKGSGRSAPLIGRLGRWQSLLGRTFSGKLSFLSASRITVSSEGGEVSSSSYTRLRGKRVDAVDVDDVPAKGRGSGSGVKAGAASSELAVAADEEMAVPQLGRK